MQADDLVLMSGTTNGMQAGTRLRDHCFAAFLRFLDNSKKLRNFINPNVFALTYSS